MPTTTIANLLWCLRELHTSREYDDVLPAIDNPDSAIDAGRAVTQTLLTLTPRQLEIVIAVADHGGSFTAAGRAIGVTTAYVVTVFNVFVGRVHHRLSSVIRQIASYDRSVA